MAANRSDVHTAEFVNIGRNVVVASKVRAGAPCHQSRVLAVETNTSTSRSLKSTKVEENSHNPAA